MRKYIIFAGVNGAGKSTLYHLKKEELKNTIRINYDEILREKYGDWRDLENQAKAMIDAKNKIDYCLGKKMSFNQETTLVGTMKTVKKAKELGYYVELYYVGIENVQIAIDRVANRVQRGGHGVKEDLIRRRYLKSQENLIKAILLCDVVRIYDNTFSIVKIASFSKGKPQFEFNELYEGWFKRLMRKENFHIEYGIEKTSLLDKLQNSKSAVKAVHELPDKTRKDIKLSR